MNLPPKSVSMSEEIALKLTRKFSGLPGYPYQNPAGIEQLVKALWKYAADEQHAKEVTDTLLLRVKFCPTPAEIYEECQASRQVREAEYVALSKRPAACSLCGGTGVRSRNHGGLRVGDKKDVIVGGEWFAAVCPCRKQGAA